MVDVCREPETIVDLGCGPGHLSAVLRRNWPHAEIVGVDSSPAMIEQARRRGGGDDGCEKVTYERADLAVWDPGRPIDLVVSNAALQWVPNQQQVLLRLRGILAPGGTLAFSVPCNVAEPSHVLLRDLAGRAPYATYADGLSRRFDIGEQGYLDLLAGPGWRLDVWRTTYLHVLQGADPVFDWIAGTGAMPVLQALPDDLRERFAGEYSAALREAYPARRYGTVLPFPRVFVVATREYDATLTAEEMPTA